MQHLKLSHWALSISSVYPFEKKVKVLVIQSCPILCDSMNYIYVWETEPQKG